jgi:transposase
MRTLARRIEALTDEIARLETERDRIIDEAAPDLLQIKGMGYHAAASLLVAAGDNPDRLSSEAAFAKLCAVAPMPVKSGQTERHRVNHGGDRQANRALHTIVVSRIRWPDDRTRDYVTRRNRNGEFKADLDTIRRLKRYIAREVYPVLIDALSTPAENPATAA